VALTNTTDDGDCRFKDEKAHPTDRMSWGIPSGIFNALVDITPDLYEPMLRSQQLMAIMRATIRL
jgi:hypothetical protein